MDAAAEIIERLRRIEARLDALAGTRHAPAVRPARVTRAQAAAILSCSTWLIDRYAARGLLVKLPKPAGKGRNAAVYFAPENVAALAVSEDAAREWVAARKYCPTTRR